MRISFLTLLGCWLALSGSSDSALPERYRELAVPRERLAFLEARQRGRALFLEHCALCHGANADGRGQRRNLSTRAADLTDTVWRRRVGARHVYWVIEQGKERTAMPAWKIFSPEQTWDLVAYVLHIADPRRDDDA